MFWTWTYKDLSCCLQWMEKKNKRKNHHAKWWRANAKEKRLEADKGKHKYSHREIFYGLTYDIFSSSYIFKSHSSAFGFVLFQRISIFRSAFVEEERRDVAVIQMATTTLCGTSRKDKKKVWCVPSRNYQDLFHHMPFWKRIRNTDINKIHQ